MLVALKTKILLGNTLPAGLKKSTNTTTVPSSGPSTIVNASRHPKGLSSTALHKSCIDATGIIYTIQIRSKRIRERGENRFTRTVYFKQKVPFITKCRSLPVVSTESSWQDCVYGFPCITLPVTQIEILILPIIQPYRNVYIVLIIACVHLTEEIDSRKCLPTTDWRQNLRTICLLNDWRLIIDRIKLCYNLIAIHKRIVISKRKRREGVCHLIINKFLGKAMATVETVEIQQKVRSSSSNDLLKESLHVSITDTVGNIGKSRVDISN